MIFRWTWIKIEKEYLYFVFFFMYRKRVKIDTITSIYFRGAFVFSKTRFPLLDIYKENNEYIFTINPKPFTKQQIAGLIKYIVKLNPSIELDERLSNFVKSM
ncbi:MAG: hypothetical protein Greene041614_125 [Parcubacteria group bacterium Greene0416_14]|nr:MAG: hypothetical protein Greene041614_125 [Parcubacteria group bacterium Greene0416_14]TSD01550.1 MAG: hypothetical protein Greene101415_130 [Parcubacteria group bacterium Greene1014_15]TSD08458.1 MAG: hypothetical protein Greene07144_88 [Parcubacteria group bacterium Greene0714_4]